MKLTVARLQQMELYLESSKEPPTLSSREFLELIAAAAWALHLGYAGSILEQRRVNEFRAALDDD